MKTPIICCVLFILLAQSLNSQWTIYQTNTTMQLNKIQFINENTGFAAGGGPFSDSAVFFRTTNAGLNWINFKIFDSTAIPLDEVYGLSFVNENTGFVCGRYMYIYKTTNGGVNWKGYKPPYYSLTQIYNALYFIDENTGYVAGRYGYFCKTTNSGLNWELTSDLSSNLYGIYFTNSNIGYVCAGDGTVYKTTNGGYNFIQSYVGPYLFESIRFISETTGFVVGHDAYYYSGIYKTINSGSTWENLLECNSELFDVFFVNPNTGYASGWNSIFKTTNRGINWVVLNKPENNAYFNIQFFSPDNGFLSGGSGRIYKTTSGGVWINQISNDVPEGFKISKCYPNPFNSELKVQISFNQMIINNSEILLEVFNTKGSKVIEKRLNINNPGQYETKIRFNECSSGIYFIRIKSGDYFTKPQKIILLK